MIDGYVYAEIRNILKEADANAFDGYAFTANLSERDLNKYSQAVYPLLVEYFSTLSIPNMTTREGYYSHKEMTKVLEDKAANDKDYLELSAKYYSLTEEILFYKSIIKKLLEVSK